MTFTHVGRAADIVTALVFTAVTFVLRAANVVSVLAQVGRGRAVADTGCVA